MRYLGLSLGMAVALGFCSAFGALVPPLYHDLFTPEAAKGIVAMVSQARGLVVVGGVIVCLTGIAVSGVAGMRKERELPEEKKKESIEEFHLVKGLIVATMSGILSACFNFGIEAGKPLAEATIVRGAHPLFQNNVIFVVLLWGGLTTNLIWCLTLNRRNGSYRDYVNRATPLLRNYAFSALAGTTWYLQFFFYGMGESKLGNGASSWILHMAFIIFVSSMWGMLLKEWKGVSRTTLRVFALGISIIVLSVAIVGYGNALSL
jgi:L-rhamnose-H+ transport protein